MTLSFLQLPSRGSGLWQPKTLCNLSKFASRPAGHHGGLIPVEDSFQGALEVHQPIPTSFVMFLSKVYYFSLQRTPRFFLSVWKHSLVIWRPFHRCQMQTFHHLNKVHTQTCNNPVCNYELLSSLKIPKKTRGVSPSGIGHLHFKNVLRQKKNYGNSSISPCTNIIFKKSSQQNQNPSRYYNSVTKLKFQHKPKYHISKIII
jgi:hypothetical protein